MKQTGHVKIIIAICSLLFAVCVALGMVLSFSKNNEAVNAETSMQNPTFSETDLDGKTLVKGSQIEIPSVKMTLNGKEYDTVSVLYNPDGTAQNVSGTVKLSSVGKYTLEYKGTANDKAYSKIDSITVYQSKFEMSDGSGQAEYSTENKSGLEGELVSLENGQTVTIHDYFDITKATATEPIFEACIIPDKKGTADFQALTIKFISKKDSSSYLEIVANYSDYNNCTYFLAGANNQTVTGYESSHDAIHVGNTWGAPISGSFKLTPNNNMSIKEDTLKIYLDYETKIVYANTGIVFVVDLDDPKYFGTLWEGFSDGEVYVEVSASRYVTSNNAQVLLLKCGDIDLKQQESFDTEAPKITIDFGDYDKANLPVGQKGVEYPIFNAQAEDYFSGTCEVTARVWARYYTSQKYELEVKDGKFFPTEAGIYIVEYHATDDSGNEAVSCVEIKITDRLDDITISLASKQTDGKTGEHIAFADIETVGGSGNVKTDIQVSLNGNSVSCTQNGFWAKKVGDYVVTVTATDYIGSVKTESYTISVTENDLPVFLDTINMPKYFIAGSTYSLENVYAYDYSNGKDGEKVKATLYTEDANGIKEHSDGCYTPSVQNHLDTIKVYYKASVNGKTAQSEVFERKVCVVGNGKSIEISKYFVSNNVSVQATSSGMVLSTTKDKSTIDFANPILANGLTYTFNVDPLQNSFSKLNVYLRDSVNEKECIKISYSKSSQNSSYISINDGAQYSILASFFGGSSHEFVVKFDNKICVASYETEVKINVNRTIYGETFAGFTSGKVYVSFEFDGVVSGGSIVVSEIGGQQTTSVKADLIKPKIDLTNEISGRYSLGDVVDLTTAVALDVLDPNISSSYTVYTPSGEVAKDVDGKVLQDISLTESYQIKLDSYGNYRVSFVAEDWNGKKEKSFSYVLEVVDVVPPVITLNGTVSSEANVGDTIDIPLAKALDIIDGNRTVYAFIYCPDGRYRAYESGMTFDYVGNYRVIYYSFDESGNTAKLIYTVSVK